MSELIRRSWDISVRSIDLNTRSVEVIASTDAIDCYGEVLVQDWDLTRYDNNPVVLYGHQSWGPDGLPIGHAEDVRVEKGDGGRKRLVAKLFFVDEKANPMGEKVWQGFLQKSLRAVSVGFRSKQGITQDIDGRTVFVLSGNELVEISVVPLPANPEAVAIAAKSMDIIRALVGAKPQHEESNMTPINIKTVLAILSLADTASEADVVDKVKTFERKGSEAEARATGAETRVKAVEGQVAQLLGAVGADSLEKALGAIEAGKAAVVELGTQVNKIDALERAKLIADAKAEKKLSPAQELGLEGKSLEFVKGFLELQHPNPVLVEKTVKQPTDSVTMPPAVAGKKWEDLEPMQKHNLLKSHPEAYEALKADFSQRQQVR